METKAIRRAIDDGYTFTGIYDFFKEKVKKRADEERKEGYLIRVLYVPSSKYSRGNRGGGYSAYAKPTKKKLKELEIQKENAEKTEQDNLKIVHDYLTTRTGVELVELLKKVLKSDMSGLDGKKELLSWAKKKKKLFNS